MIEVYVDGACMPKNPGGTATYGYVIKKDGMIIGNGSGVIGTGKEMSNNVAEYEGLNQALKWLIAHPQNDEITICSDSKMLINQCNGKWHVNRGTYVSYYAESLDLRKELGVKVTFKWVPRNQNMEADALSQAAYQETVKNGTPKATEPPRED